MIKRNKSYYKGAIVFCLMVLFILLFDDYNDKNDKFARAYINSDKKLHSTCGGVKKISLSRGSRDGRYLFDTYGKYGCKLSVYIECNAEKNMIFKYRIIYDRDSFYYYYNLVY